MTDERQSCTPEEFGSWNYAHELLVYLLEEAGRNLAGSKLTREERREYRCDMCFRMVKAIELYKEIPHNFRAKIRDVRRITSITDDDLDSLKKEWYALRDEVLSKSKP